MIKDLNLSSNIMRLVRLTAPLERGALIATNLGLKRKACRQVAGLFEKFIGRGEVSIPRGMISIEALDEIAAAVQAEEKPLYLRAPQDYDNEVRVLPADQIVRWRLVDRQDWEKGGVTVSPPGKPVRDKIASFPMAEPCVNFTPVLHRLASFEHFIPEQLPTRNEMILRLTADLASLPVSEIEGLVKVQINAFLTAMQNAWFMKGVESRLPDFRKSRGGSINIGDFLAYNLSFSKKEICKICESVRSDLFVAGQDEGGFREISDTLFLAEILRYVGPYDLHGVSKPSIKKIMREPVEGFMLSWYHKKAKILKKYAPAEAWQNMVPHPLTREPVSLAKLFPDLFE